MEENRRIPQISLVLIKKTLPLLIFCFISQYTVVVQAQDAKTHEMISQMEEYNKLLNPSAKQKVIQSSRSLGTELFTSNKGIDLHAISTSRIKNQFEGFTSQEIDAIVMLVMFELWKSEEEDIKEIVNELHKMNEAKKKQRECLEHYKKQKSLTENKIQEEYKTNTKTISQKRIAKTGLIKETVKTSLLNIKYTRTPKLPVCEDPSKMSASELDQAITTTNAVLSTLEDIDQLDQLAMQDAMQKQAQILQLMSNISKMLHDTLKGIIQNLK